MTGFIGNWWWPYSYLEIGDGVLTEVKHAQLEYEISCLDINPIGRIPTIVS
jgi:hypothetical protein